MSETKDEETPTADDIVDDLAEEMGVDGEKPSDIEESDDAEEKADDAEEADDAEDEEADGAEEADDDKMAGLDGVFSVKKGKKKKKRKKKKKKKKKGEGREKPELFTPGEGDVDLTDDEYLGLDDLDDEPASSPVNKLLVAIIVVLLVGMGAIAQVTTGVFDDIVLLLQGDYQEEMQRRAAAEEEAYLLEQLEGMPRYGNLFITGSPREALIYLNGEVQYGETPSGGQWRELRVRPDTVIRDLSIDEVHEIVIEHPGHDPFEITLTEQMWEPAASDFQFSISANLSPQDSSTYEEFNDRMLMGEGAGPFHGKVGFKTNPEGAHLIVNSLYARDEDGEKLVTPVELEEYWTYDIDTKALFEDGRLADLVEDELVLEEYEEAEDLEGVDARRLNVDETMLSVDDEAVELEERKFRVDMPPDRGNGIEIAFPEDHDDYDELPVYATMLQRTMWNCDWKDDDERERISDSAPMQEHCNYVFDFDKDFYELADYIERREAERKRIEEERRQAAQDSDDDDDDPS